MKKLKSTEGTTITDTTTTITKLIAAKLELEARPLNPQARELAMGQQCSNSFSGILFPNKIFHCIKQMESRAAWWRPGKDRAPLAWTPQISTVAPKTASPNPRPPLNAA